MVTLVRSALAVLWSYCFFFSAFMCFFFFTHCHYLLRYRFPMYITKENEGNSENIESVTVN